MKNFFSVFSNKIYNPYSKRFAFLPAILVCTTFTIQAFADILFVDLNNVDQEIEVVSRQASERNERLIILPLNRKQFKEKYKDFLKVKNTHEEIKFQIDQFDCYLDENKSNNTCERLIKIESSLSKKMQTLDSPKYLASTFKSELESLASHSNITTLMISGHSGSGYFEGDFGRISADEFFDILRKTRSLPNLNSIFTLGCGSSTPYTFGAVWNAAMPQAKLVAGYENTGFLRTNPQGHALIRNLLRSESLLISANNPTEAETILRKIAPSNQKYRIAASLFFGNKLTYVSSHGPSSELYKLLQCGKQEFLLQNALSFIDCAHKKNGICDFRELNGFNLYEIKSCRFIIDSNVLDVPLVRKDLNTLHLLSYETMFQPIRLFKGIDPKIAELSGLFSENESLAQLKYKISVAKDAYEKMNDFDFLAKLSPSEVDNVSIFSDLLNRALVALSEWDYQKISNLRDRSNNGAGLRARAFFEKFKTLPKDYQKELFDNRIESLIESKGKINFDKAESPRKMLQLISEKDFYDKEINALKFYRDLPD